MANRDVTITLKVKDGEVKTATASVERLKKAASDVGPIASSKGPDGAAAAAAKRLGISYDEYTKKVKLASAGSREVTRAITDTTAAAKVATPAIAGASGGVASLTAALGPATLASVGLTAAAAALGVALLKGSELIFNLVKSYSDYVNEVKRANEMTGLNIGLLSALKVQSELTGRSYDEIGTGIKNFTKLIGDANNGKKEAIEKMGRLGIDGQKAAGNLEGAFQQAINRVLQLPPGVQQAAAAVDAFGEEGIKLLPFLKEFGGNLGNLQGQARELGLILGEEDVKASTEFKRALAEVQAQLQGIGITLGRELLPVVRDVFREFGDTLNRNKSDIKSWAESIASFVRGFVDGFRTELEDIKGLIFTINLLSQGVGPAEFGRQMGEYAANLQRQNMKRDWERGLGPVRPVDPNVQNSVPTRIPGVNYDPAPYFSTPAVKMPKVPKAQKSPEQKQAEELSKIISGLNTEIAFFGQTTEVSKVAQQFWGQAISATNIPLAEQAVKLAKNLDAMKAKAEADKKALEFEKELAAITSAGRDERTGLEGTLAELQQQIALGRELTDIEKTTIQNRQALILLQNKLEDEKKTGEQVSKAVQELRVQQSLTLEIQKQVQAARERLELEAKRKVSDKAFKSYSESLEDELLLVSRNNRELTRYEQVLLDIERAQHDWTDEQKESLLTLAAQADAIDELNKKHKELKDFFSDSLQYVFEGDFDGLFRSLQRRVAEPFIDRISSFLATEVLGFDPNATDNPVAKPIVGKITQTNEILNRMLVRMGGTPVGGGVAGLALGALTGGGIPGIGPGGTGVFNPFAGSNLNGPTGSFATLPNGEQAFNVNGSGENTGNRNGNFLGNLKNLFSTKPGGIFAARNNVLTGKTSRMGGIAGGIGDLASLAGGLIGGRAGGILSSVGTGLSIGSMFGPWGAAIGAGIGFIAGLFGGDPKRKADKKENIPALNKGFVDALKQLNDILAGVRSLSIDPDEAISRANEVRAEIAGGFGIQFQSKKYRKQAQTMIAGKLGQADAIIAQIKAGAEIARGAADRSKRILPEFAGGHYFADFFKPNGLLPGMFDGRDNILAMISRGEMVLNPNQQNRVRAIAGHDVFAGAGIPNYPKGSTSPKLAMGGIANTGLALAATPNVTVQPNFTMFVEGVNFDERSRAWIESDGGKRTIVKLIKKEKKLDSSL
jgi:hypothetical protein